MQRAVMLTEELSPRESATDEESEAALSLADDFSSWGYDVQIQEFDAFWLYEPIHFFVLTLDVIGPDTDRVYPTERGHFVYSRPLDAASLSGPGGEVTRGLLAFAGSASPDDLAAAQLAGKIALIERGGLPLDEQVDSVARAGAKAAVVFNDVPGDRYSWEWLISEVSIPAIDITRNQGLRLLQALESGRDVEVEITTLSQVQAQSRNVIAELNNDRDGDGLVVIGAHVDTTPRTQGANDNGSGLAVVSIVAQELADDSLPFDLRFVLFGAEEIGLNGSYHYVRKLTPADRSRIEAMINLDVVGVGSLSATGSESLMSVANELSRALAPPDDIRTRRSDHIPFLVAGAPTLFIYADNLDFINSPEDRVERLEAEPLSAAVALTLGIVQRLAYGAQSSLRR